MNMNSINNNQGAPTSNWFKCNKTKTVHLLPDSCYFEGFRYFDFDKYDFKFVPFEQFFVIKNNDKDELIKSLEEIIHLKQENFKENFSEITHLKRIRNQIFYIRNNGVFPEIPIDILRKIFCLTNPKEIEKFKLVCKYWKRAATLKTQIISLNNQLDLKKSLPPKIESSDDAIEWLKRDLNACYQLKNLDLRGFHNLTENNLDCLIEICPNLNYLYFNSNLIKNVNKLPASLTLLECRGCEYLVNLPNLPQSLKYLDCSYCKQLKNLPNLPESLIALYCGNCDQIASLPDLPTSLKWLVCSNSLKLKSLPALPSALLQITCQKCPLLETLPILPDSLERLNCSDCQFATLPELPPTLKTLICNNSLKLLSLPALPRSIRVVEFENCPLFKNPPNPSETSFGN